MDSDRTILAHARLSRRAVLQRALGCGLVAAAGGAWLAACGGTTPPATTPPTVAPAATATATAVPPPTATASPAVTSTPAPPAILRLPYGAEPQQFGDLRLPAGPGPHPTAIVVHGGGWAAMISLEYLAPICVALAARGIATWNIEYRRLGNPGGGWPGTFLDAAAAADHLRVLARDYPLDLARVGAVGHSSGGTLALWLGGRRRIPAGSPLAQPDPLPVRAVIALAANSDLARAWDLRLNNGVMRDLLGGTPQDYPDRYAAASPIALLPLGTRQILVHGEIDEMVPFQMSVDYQAAATASGDDAALIALPRAGHSELVRPNSDAVEKALATIVAALAR